MKVSVKICTAAVLASASVAQAECVVLLHGLARSSTSFLVLENVLEAVGYDVVNADYPSTSYTIEKLASDVVPRAIAKCPKGGDIHFVTHSMGGILLRYHFQDPENRPKNLGATVMLAPPHKGSYLVDQLAEVPGFDLWNGEAGLQLSAAADSLPNRLGPLEFPVGIIAGSQSISPVFSSIIPGEDDGKVSIESTKVDGMDDHIVLPVTHTFIMNDPTVIMHVATYLREGAFKRREK